MMTLRGFVLVITTVMLRHFAVVPDVIDESRAVRIVVGLSVMFCCLGKACAAMSSLRYPALSAADTWRHFELRRSQLEWIWVGALPWMLGLSGLGGVLAQAQADGWPHVVLLSVWFVPSLVFLLALDFCAVQLEEDLLSMAARHRRRHASPSKVPVSGSSRWLARVRLGTTGGVIVCLVPVLVAIGAIDLVEACLPASSSSAQAVIALFILASVCLTMSPRWMKWWIGAKPAPAHDVARRRVMEMCEQLKLRSPLVMNVVGSPAWQGAAVVGWTVGGRQLWLGTHLISTLSAAELDMVLLHELAHLKRGHCWWRLGSVLACGAIAVVATAALGNLIDTAVQPATVIASVVAAVLVLTSISRWCELDADLQACRYALAVCPWAGERPACAPGALYSALCQLQDSQADPRSWQWLHPTLERRRASLAKQFGAGDLPATLAG